MIKWLKNLFKEKKLASEDRPYRNVPSEELLSILKKGFLEVHDAHGIVNELLERLIRKET